ANDLPPGIPRDPELLPPLPVGDDGGEATFSFLSPLFRDTSRTCGRRFRTTSPCLSRRCATDFGLATATRFRRSCAARTARFTAFALTAGLHRRTPRSLSLLARCGYFLAPTGGAFRFRTRTARIAQTDRFFCGSANRLTRRRCFTGNCADHAAHERTHWTANAPKHRPCARATGGFGNRRDGNVLVRLLLFVRCCSFS